MFPRADVQEFVCLSSPCPCPFLPLNPCKSVIVSNVGLFWGSSREFADMRFSLNVLAFGEDPQVAQGWRTHLPMQDTRDAGSIPGLGRSPRAADGNTLQCSCLENPTDRGAWRAAVHGVTKSQTRLSEDIWTLGPMFKVRQDFILDSSFGWISREQLQTHAFKEFTVALCLSVNFSSITYQIKLN